MNTPRWVVISSAVVLLCAAGSVSAALISWDWKTPGDNLLTYDSATGLDWLDWTESTNRSYNDVLTQLGPGGEFEGFRHASTDEVHTLFEHAGIPDIPGYTAANYTPVTELQALLGITRTYSGMGEVTYSVGMTSTPRFS